MRLQGNASMADSTVPDFRCQHRDPLLQGIACSISIELEEAAGPATSFSKLFRDDQSAVHIFVTIAAKHVAAKSELTNSVSGKFDACDFAWFYFRPNFEIR